MGSLARLPALSPSLPGERPTRSVCRRHGRNHREARRGPASTQVRSLPKGGHRALSIDRASATRNPVLAPRAVRHRDEPRDDGPTRKAGRRADPRGRVRGGQSGPPSALRRRGAQHHAGVYRRREVRGAALHCGQGHAASKPRLKSPAIRGARSEPCDSLARATAGRRTADRSRGRTRGRAAPSSSRATDSTCRRAAASRALRTSDRAPRRTARARRGRCRCRRCAWPLRRFSGTVEATCPVYQGP
jgi:hypothetical protein